MERAAGAGVRAGRSCKPSAARGIVLAFLSSAGTPLLAQPHAEAPAEVLVAQAAGDPPGVHLEVRASTLPRIDAQDTGFQGSRVDLSLAPAGGTGLSPVFGMSTPGPSGPGMLPQRTSLDFGLRWSHGLNNQRQIDITAWRRMNAPDDAYSLTQRAEPVYGARFELNLAPVRRLGLALDTKFIGLQLQGGGRITVRRKNGGPMVYYRTSF
jgi:hypothetical protein